MALEDFKIFKGNDLHVREQIAEHFASIDDRLTVLEVGGPMISAAIDGQYFVATNPTWGTGIALSSATRTTFLATECAALMINASTTVQTIPHFIRMTCTAAGTAMTSLNFGVILDSVNRYSAGGTTLTAANAKSDSAAASINTVRFGNITTTAATAPRQIARITPKTVAAPAWNIGDSITFWFGQPATGSLGSQSTAAATDMEYVLPPVVMVGTIQSLLLHYWGPGQTGAPSCEVSMGWWERTP